MTGKLTEPRDRDARRPTSRSSATSTCRRPTSPRLRELELPAWARSVIPGPKGAPLLYAGVRAGVPTRRPRVRAAPVRPAAPGRVPDPDREPHRRADGRQSPPPADAVTPGDPVTLPIPTGATGLRVERPDGSVVELAPGTAGGTQRHLHPDRPAGRLHRPPPIRPAPTRPIRQPRPIAVATPVAVADAAPHPAAQARRRTARPERPGPLRRRPVRRRRVDDRARLRRSSREARAGSRVPGASRRSRGVPGPRRGAPRGHRPATSCGSRSCSSSSSACASSGRCTTATS